MSFLYYMQHLLYVVQRKHHAASTFLEAFANFLESPGWRELQTRTARRLCSLGRRTSVGTVFGSIGPWSRGFKVMLGICCLYSTQNTQTGPAWRPWVQGVEAAVCPECWVLGLTSSPSCEVGFVVWFRVLRMSGLPLAQDPYFKPRTSNPQVLNPNVFPRRWVVYLRWRLQQAAATAPVDLSAIQLTQ